MFMDDASWLEIDLSRVTFNLSCWKALVNTPTPLHQRITPVKVCAVVKADAYGLGVLPIARELEKSGVDMLAVYSPLQAMELLEAGVKAPLLVLMPMNEKAWELSPAIRQAVRENRLHWVVNDPGQWESARRIGEQCGACVPVHLHVDTGMSRLGLSPAQVGGVLEKFRSTKSVQLVGVMSHLATAHTDGALDEVQRQRFETLLGNHERLREPDVIKHLAATAGACRGVEYHYDLVRIGIGLWGYGPDLSAGSWALKPLELKPVVRWRSPLVHVQQYQAGETVGYGRTYQLRRASVLGVVPTGYADGYPLALSNCGKVLVETPAGWREASVLGRVSMDQIVIDLTDLELVHRGALVELLSAERGTACSLPVMARNAQTSEYEILCRLSPRLPRKHVTF